MHPAITEFKKFHVGPQHIKTKIKQARNNNYTFETSINELLDYPILKANNINIETTIIENKFYKLSIEDDCEGGFINLFEGNEKNPFNFGYDLKEHDDDETISEFGTGMKQAAVSTGNKFTIYTNVKDIYVKICFEFPVMMNEKTVSKSYDPTEIEQISEEVYKKFHRFKEGSTLILEEILPDVLSTSSTKNIDKELSNSIRKTYSKILLSKKDTLKLVLNGNIIQGTESVFTKNNCKPFTIERHLIIKKGKDDRPIFIEYNPIEDNKDKQHRKYKTETGKYSQIKGKEKDNIMKMDNYFQTGYLCETRSMVVMLGTGTQFLEENSINTTKLPKGELMIYKLDRFHGSIPDESSNGAKNYVAMEMKYKSKELGKLFGSNYNKTINFNRDNEFTKAVKQLKSEISSSLAYDTSTPKAWKIYEKALQHEIVVHESKIPEKFKNKNENTYDDHQNVLEEDVNHEKDEEKEEHIEQDEVENEDAEEEDEYVENEHVETSVVDKLRSSKSKSINNIKMVYPNYKHIGVGRQTRHTKLNVVTILDKVIPKIMSTLEGDKLVNFKDKICVRLEDMCMEKLNRQETNYKHHYAMACKCGFEFMKEQYYKLIKDRTDLEEVVGGSLLDEFYNKYCN